MTRSSGVLMHISSLWGDYSEGSFGNEAKAFIDFISECGFSIWQTLPFCLPDDCNSPYKSYSAFSGNPYFIDLPTLFEEGLITRSELEDARQRTPYSCEFDRLKCERIALLSKAAYRFTDRKAIDSFMEKHPQIDKFCTFMALKKSNGERAWTEWTDNTPNEEALKTWRFIQYTFFKQWAKIKEYANRKGVAIIGDIPIYVAHDSSDVWSDPSQFLLEKDGTPSCVAGVPPDYFCEDGQLWGNPIYDWERMKSENYKWWRERMSFMCELFDGVRIDHFRGFESYYSVPSGEKTARNGKWVKGPGIDFINAIKKTCEHRLIIAEDLGIITPEVHKLVAESGFPSMRVLQFGFLGDDNSPHMPHNFNSNCVAYTGTHDNNTLLGYVWELDEATRRKLLAYCGYDGADWNKGYNAILRTMFQSHASTLILPIQDLLLYGSDTRLNTPGKSDGNWSYRVTWEQLSTIDRKKFRDWNRLYGRSSSNKPFI